MAEESAGVLLEARSCGKPHVLVFAYACEPGRGSEPGAGWGVVRALASLARCTVLVGSEHSAAIQRWQSTHQDTSIRFVEVPIRSFLGRSGQHELLNFVLYLRWLREARMVALKLHENEPFDATVHATYSTYWLPTPAVGLGIPCIWGPVGGAVTTPLSLWPLLGWGGILTQLVEIIAVRTLSLLPATRRTWRGATVVLVQNDATLQRLPPSTRHCAKILNHALFTELPATSQMPLSSCVFVGSLEPRKAPQLALLALACTPPDVRLVFVGDGPERHRLERLARKLDLAARVEFRGALPRAETLQLVAGATAVVFTGVREEGGIALAEAMLLGVPVAVLAHGGAATIARLSTDPTSAVLIEPGGVRDTARGIARAMTDFTRNPRASREPLLDVRTAREELERVVRVALNSKGRSGAYQRKP